MNGDDELPFFSLAVKGIGTTGMGGRPTLEALAIAVSCAISSRVKTTGSKRKMAGCSEAKAMVQKWRDRKRGSGCRNCQGTCPSQRVQCRDVWEKINPSKRYK